jgi:uncharacterized protein YbjT (DUF2867 family)
MTAAMARRDKLILLTGASGYIGGRLLRELEQGSYSIRCLARKPEYLEPRIAADTQIVPGDVFDTPSLAKAMEGVHTAYYLVHSLAGPGSFEENDRIAARNFGQAAVKAGVRKIIYLGGLGREPGLSHHLSSRQEVGKILGRSGVPTIELRASIVIGSGSLSFEMVRALVQKLPVMTTPRWVRMPAQPISIEDVLSYLMAALTHDVPESVVYEIGGADRVSYEGLMREYAKARGLKRLILPLPVLSPGLSSLWLALITPLYFRVGRRLIEGVRNPTVVNDDRAARIFGIEPMGIEEAVCRALENEDREFAETRWNDALPSRSLEHHWGGVRFGTRLVDSREMRIPCSPEKIFQPIQCIGGGERGWYSYNWLWSLRGFIDKLIGGVGSGRQPRYPYCLMPGDVVGFWRVEAMQPNRSLRLHAEMKLPGRAWLQFEVEGGDEDSVLRTTAIFDPIGLWGLLYWYVLYPLHVPIFKGMLRGIARSACQSEGVILPANEKPGNGA